MVKSYVEERDGHFIVAGSRVSLESVVVAFTEGLSPETIATECFPVLSLEQVYGAIAFYLAHREQVDDGFSRADAEYDALREETRRKNPGLLERLAEARRRAVAGQ